MICFYVDSCVASIGFEDELERFMREADLSSEPGRIPLMGLGKSQRFLACYGIKKRTLYQ